MNSRRRLRRAAGSPPAQNGRAIRELRLDAGIPQQQLAARVGISPSLMCEIESGTRSADVDVLRLLAAVLKVPVDEIEYRDDTCTCMCHAKASA